MLLNGVVICLCLFILIAAQIAKIFTPAIVTYTQTIPKSSSISPPIAKLITLEASKVDLEIPRAPCKLLEGTESAVNDCITRRSSVLRMLPSDTKA